MRRRRRTAAGRPSSFAAMYLLIDSPVGPFSSAAEIEAWLDRLEGTRRRYAGRADAIAQVEREKTSALELLRLARLRAQRK